MNDDLTNDDRYFTRLAAAFVRGTLTWRDDGSTDDEIIRAGVAQGLRLHKFKRQTALPRVQRVLGLLRGLYPASLLDIGSGRGTFLWPLADSFPVLEITALDCNPVRVRDIDAVREGGTDNLRAVAGDAQQLAFDDGAFDIVTMLEVLEHLPNPAQAAREAVRVSSRFVIVSVPSHEDDNPEHIHLFDANSLTALFLAAGGRKVQVEYVPSHIVALIHA